MYSFLRTPYGFFNTEYTKFFTRLLLHREFQQAEKEILFSCFFTNYINEPEVTYKKDQLDHLGHNVAKQHLPLRQMENSKYQLVFYLDSHTTLNYNLLTKENGTDQDYIHF